MKYLRIAAIALTVLLTVIFVLGIFLTPRWAGVTPDTRAAAEAQARKPCAPRAYPPESLAAGEQGMAWVAYTTGPDGAVVSARITRSSGYARLDAASLEHIRTCRFRPDVNHGSLIYKWLPH